jgi:hypothetical protein
VKRGKGSVVVLAIVLGAALLAFVGGPAAAPAAAATYCAPGPCTEGIPEPTIEKAVELADGAAGPDTVAIAPGTHEVAEPGCGGLYVSDESTYVRGAGIGTTVLTLPHVGLKASGDVICGYMHLSDLTLRLPSDVATSNTTVSGIDLYGGLVERIRIDAPGSVYGPGLNDGEASAGTLRSGVAHDIEVDLDPAQDTEGLRVGGMEEVSDVTVRAQSSALSVYTEPEPGDGPTLVRGVVLHSQSPLAVSNSNEMNGRVEISDAILDASGTPAGEPSYGLQVFNGIVSHSIELTMDRVTIVGNGAPESTALMVNGQGPIPTVFHASHLAVTGFPRSLVLGRYGGDSLTTIEYSDIDLSPGAIAEEGPKGTPTTAFGPGNRSGDPLLSAPAAGDYVPMLGSPAIDIGGPDLLPSSPRDLLGDPRPLDGDGDGVALVDAGALEAPVPPPAPPGNGSGGNGAGTGKPATPRKVSILVLGKKLLLTPGGVAKVRLRCPASESAPPCRGSVAVRTRGMVDFAGKRRRLGLGHGTFSIGAGAAAWVRLKLTPAKASLIRSDPAARRVLALVKVGAAAGGAASLTQRLRIVPAAPHRHKTPSA